MVTRFKSDGVALFVLTLIIALYFFPIFFGSHTLFFGDIFTGSFPLITFFLRNITHGIFPLWNPYNFGGYPLASDMTSGMYYVPFLLLIPFFPLTIKIFSIFVVLHFFMAAYSMYALGRQIKLTPLSAAIAACCFALSGILINYLADITRLLVVMYYPLFFLALLYLIKKPCLRSILLPTIVLLLQFGAGHIQYVFLELLIAPVWMYVYSNKSTFIKNMILLTLAVLLSFGLMSFVLISNIELYRYSARTLVVTAGDISKNFSLNPKTIIRLFFAHFWGIRNEGSAWGTMDTTSIGYIGFLSLLLILYSLRFILQSKMSRTIFVIAITSLLVAFGQYTPLYALFIRIVPFARLFRNPMAYLALYTFMMSILAGYAFEQFQFPKRLIWKLLVPVLIVFCGVNLFLCITLRYPTFPHDVLVYSANLIGKKLSSFHSVFVDFEIGRMIGLNISIVFGLLLLALIFRKKTILAALIICDLFIFTKGNLFTIPVTDILVKPTVAAYLSDHLGNYRYFSTAGTVPYSGFDDVYGSLTGSVFGSDKQHENLQRFVHEQKLIPENYGMYYQLPHVGGKETYMLSDTVSCFVKGVQNPLFTQAATFNPEIAKQQKDTVLTKIDFSGIDFNDDAFDQFATKYIITDRDIGLKHHTLVFVDDGVYLYENKQALPIVEILDANGVTVEVPMVKHVNVNHIEVPFGHKGTLVVRNTFYPGWQAKVNGNIVPIARYDRIFQSVVLPDEQGVAVLQFAPKTFWYGGIISGISLGLFCMCFFQKRTW